MARKFVLEKVTFKQQSEGSDGAVMTLSDSKAFKAGGTASTKSLRWRST